MTAILPDTTGVDPRSQTTDSSAQAVEVDRLLDRVEEALNDDLVPVEIYNHEALFEAEMQRIFTKCWVFVAHESEIPRAGDFVQRRIGVDPVIVTRDGKGGINVLSNYCRHRGTQVCQTDSGNSRFFTCRYHGWTYANNGDLVGTPHMQSAYGQRLDAREWGLMRAPRVAVRQGFIFASLSQDGPSLDDYLGGAGWMFDLLTGLHPDGMRVAGPPERYKLKADWKTGAENFAGDTYHVDSLHFSTEEVGISQGLHGNNDITRIYDFGNGHGSIAHAWAETVDPAMVLWGYGPDMAAHFDLSGLDDAQTHMVTQTPPSIGTFFPNLSFIRIPVTSHPDRAPTVITSFRQWQPTGPGEFEMWNWQFVWNFMTDEQVSEAYLAGQFTFGSAGVFEQDDTVAWEGAPRAARSPWMRKEGMRFNFQQAHRSPVDQTPDPDYQGPGIRRKFGYGEQNQLSFYRHWLKTMRDDRDAAAKLTTEPTVKGEQK